MAFSIIIVKYFVIITKATFVFDSSWSLGGGSDECDGEDSCDAKSELPET
jgi:hypothetical protein